MKQPKLKVLAAVAALIWALQPATSWSTRILAGAVSGAITASPSSGQIEVEHRTYHIKANSSAEKTARSLYLGQKVDIVLDGAPGAEPEVVAITVHPEG